MARINLAAQAALSQDRLHDVLIYDPISGVFTYRISRLHGRCAVRAGDRAGKENPKSHYRYINIDGYAYLEHRLAVFYMSGKWPENEVDHEDGQRNANHWTNLRDATGTQNKQNASHPVGASGLRGARLRWDKKRWISAIKVDGKSVHLGAFDTAAEAHAAYLAAKARLHPFQPIPRDVRT